MLVAIQKLPPKQWLQQRQRKTRYRMEVAHVHKHVQSKELSHAQHKSKKISRKNTNKFSSVLQIAAFNTCTHMYMISHY